MCPQLSGRWDRFLGKAVSTSALLFGATHWPKEQRAGFGDTAPRRKPGQRPTAPKESAPGVAVAGPEGAPSAGGRCGRLAAHWDLPSLRAPHSPLTGSPPVPSGFVGMTGPEGMPCQGESYLNPPQSQ